MFSYVKSKFLDRVGFMYNIPKAPEEKDSMLDRLIDRDRYICHKDVRANLSTYAPQHLF